MGRLAGPALADPLDGVITGQLSNGTSGGSNVAGDSVNLLVFGVKEQAALDRQTTSVGADGRYTFTGVDRDPNKVYLVVATHQTVSYPAAQPFQLKDQQTYDTDLQVYDTTSADDAIRLQRANLLVAGVQPGTLQVNEMGSLVNDGDRTFVTPDPQNGAAAHALRFSLPKGALDVSFQSGFRTDDMIAGVGGVQITSPLRPGQQDYAISFTLPYTGTGADLSIQAPYPADTMNVYLPPAGIQLSSDILQPGSQSQLGGQTYTVYTATNVAVGAILRSQLSQLPSPAGGLLTPTQLALIALGVALVVLGAGVFLYTVRRPSAAPARSAIDEDELEQERRRLIMRLAALDERFADGSLGHDEYYAERHRGKERLLELTAVRRTVLST